MIFAHLTGGSHIVLAVVVIVVDLAFWWSWFSGSFPDSGRTFVSETAACAKSLVGLRELPHRKSGVATAKTQEFGWWFD